MSKLKTFALQSPVLFSMLSILIGIFLTELPLQNLLAPYFGLQPAFYLAVTLEQGLTGLLCFILLARFGWLAQAGFTPPSRWKALWIGWPLVVFVLINGALDLFTGDVIVDTAQPLLILLHALVALSTGWVEEVLCRGVVVTTLLHKWGQTRRGIYRAVLVSSLLFGVAHLVNFLQGRKTLLENVSQITYALFFGVIFAACLLRNRSIWPVIILHAAFDWAATLPEIAVGGGLPTTVSAITPSAALVSILITLPLFLYGLFVLRKVEPTSLDLEKTPCLPPVPSPVAIS